MFLLSVEARLIAAGIDVSFLSETPTSTQQVFVPSSVSVSSASSSTSPLASTTASAASTVPRTRGQQRQQQQQHQGSATTTTRSTPNNNDNSNNNNNNYDDDDDDEDDEGNTAPASVSTTTTATTPSGAINPLNRQVDAAIFAFILPILQGNPLQLIVANNPSRSGVLALQRLQQRYVPAGKDFVNRLQLQLRNTEWRSTDDVDSFTNSINQTTSQLSRCGVEVNLEDLWLLVRSTVPEKFDLTMRFLDQQQQRPSFARITAALLEEERRLNHRASSSSTTATALFFNNNSSSSSNNNNSGGSNNTYATTSRGGCCPPKDKLTCSFCNFKGHCAQVCFKLAAAKKHRLINVDDIIETLRSNRSNSGTNNNSSTSNKSGRYKGGKRSFSNSNSSSSSNSRSTSTYNRNTDGASSNSSSSSNDMHEIFVLSVDGTLATADGDWIADTGATAHITGDRSLFCDFTSIAAGDQHQQQQQVVIANQQSLKVAGTGTVRLTVRSTLGHTGTISLRNVLLVPGISYNLLALGLVTHNREGEATGNEVIISKEATINFPHWSVRLVRAPNGHILLRTVVNAQRAALSASTAPAVTTEQHDRLGHRNDKDVRAILSQNDSATTGTVDCGPCEMAKSTRMSVPKTSAARTAPPCQLLYADMAGPLEVTTAGGFRFALTFVDDNTRFAWTYLLKRKSDAAAALAQLRRHRHVVNGLRGTTLQTDSDAVFKSAEFRDTVFDFSMKQRFSPPHTQAKNGAVERLFRTLFNTTRALLFASSLDSSFWGHAVLHATLLYNISPHRGGPSPSESLLGRQIATVDRLQKFGAPAYVHVEKTHRRKLDPRARKGIYVGFSEEDQAHRIFFPDTQRVVTSIHVRFGTAAEEEERRQQLPTVGNGEDTGVELTLKRPKRTAPTVATPTPSPPPPAPITPSLQPQSQHGVSSNSYGWFPTDTVVDIPDGVDPLTMDDSDGDGVTGTGGNILTALPVNTTTDNTAPEPSLNAPASNAATADPSSLAAALASPDASEWREAIRTELTAMVQNDVYEIVPRGDVPRGTKPIRSMFIFRKKLDDKGRIIKYKARWVAKGFSQKKGIDYSETFAPTAYSTSIRTLLAT
ncbi:MAG: DDE-type integrase/transposase/recombinase, partial [Planctomycetes bacterium]|nr:DDE-type integrase/transposase/recombinase [Planctomycetota bacterium]